MTKNHPARLMRHIDVVLVRPKQPGNIGAVARAMKNLGAARLILVDAADHLSPEALRMAYGAQEILRRATRRRSLREAVSQYRLVLGTTTRTHKGYGRPALLSTVRRSIRAHTRRWRVAIVFGSEQNGLTNDDLARCQLLTRLPMAGPSPSYNLSQAVLLVLYELFAHAGGPTVSPARRPARSRELELMHAEWEQLLTAIGFVKGRQGQHILMDLRRILSRARPDAREVRIMRGIVRQVQWHRAQRGDGGY